MNQDAILSVGNDPYLINFFNNLVQIPHAESVVSSKPDADSTLNFYEHPSDFLPVMGDVRAGAIARALNDIKGNAPTKEEPPLTKIDYSVLGV
ncbi:MAG: hypothetical protein KDJ75_08765 [Alphaproteobacteria bacterium]|nr:hypothetical protein [Alphaproteobacteria bacterium]